MIQDDDLGLVLEDLVDQVQREHRQDLVHGLARHQELHVSLLLDRPLLGGDQFADARAVHVVDVLEIDDQAGVTVGDETFHGLFQGRHRLAEDELPLQVQDADAARFADLHLHDSHLRQYDDHHSTAGGAPGIKDSAAARRPPAPFLSAPRRFCARV